MRPSVTRIHLAKDTLAEDRTRDQKPCARSLKPCRPGRSTKDEIAKRRLLRCRLLTPLRSYLRIELRNQRPPCAHSRATFAPAPGGSTLPVRVAGGPRPPSGQIIENRYRNRYRSFSRTRGKLKRVIDMRMWRNWQTRWI